MQCGTPTRRTTRATASVPIDAANSLAAPPATANSVSQAPRIYNVAAPRVSAPRLRRRDVREAKRAEEIAYWRPIIHAR